VPTLLVFCVRGERTVFFFFNSGKTYEKVSLRVYSV
jgi:hypothetical protein